MTYALTLLASCLLLMALAGLVRVLRGPTTADRMLAAQLIGSTAVAILVVLGAALGRGAFLDMALVFAILAAVALVTFVASTRSASGRETRR